VNLLKLDLRIFRRVRFALAWRTEPVTLLYSIANVLYSGVDGAGLLRGLPEAGYGKIDNA
jgi:hypothetical protein